MKYDLKGHSSTFIYVMKNFMNANIIKQFFHNIVFDLNCHFYVMEKFCYFFTLRPFNLITNLDLRSYGQLLSLFC